MIRDTAGTTLGFLVVFVVLELITLLLINPRSGSTSPIGKIAQYLDYGLSTESKIAGAAATLETTPSQALETGWIDAQIGSGSPEWLAAEHRVVVYGMSFTNLLAGQLRDLDPDLGVLTRSGPAAPLSHAYAMFDADPAARSAHTVVVGVLSSSVPDLQSMTSMTRNPTVPAPFTYPSFRSIDGQLERTDPAFTSLAAFLRAFNAKGKEWNDYISDLERFDAYWEPFLFKSTPLDRFATTRLARRAWFRRHVDAVSDDVYTNTGRFRVAHPAIAAVPLILRSMADTCSSRGQQLVIVLLHARGQPQALGEWLTPALADSGAEIVSTADLFSSADEANFLPDMHYQPELDRLIATRVLSLINEGSHAPAAR